MKIIIHDPLKNLGKAMENLANNINTQSNGESMLFSPNYPHFAWKLSATHLFWHQNAKKNGLKGKVMIGVYFSGTGNTKHCVEKFIEQYDNNSIAISIETPNLNEVLIEHNMIVFGYPVYFSNAPKIVRDFIAENKELFHGKEIFIIATMGLFSGDGAGCTARLFRKYHAKVIGGLHLKMPDCIGDEKALKKTLEANKEIVRQADVKIGLAAAKLKEGVPTKEGLNFFYHIAGLLGQRLWFYGKTLTYKGKPNVDKQKCIGCRRCSELCPMQNIEIVDGKAVSHNQCTMCYRCFSNCPTKALTILGKQIYEQCLCENYQ